jgi:poly-gamma-glutamate synthesis protein (capsule biosynthesis protein)
MVRLKLAGIDFIGADLNEEAAFSPIIKDVKGVKIGFLAYTDLGPKGWRATSSSPGMAWIQESDFPKIQEDIFEAKKEVDILIVSLHAGTEYESLQNQSQEDFAKMAIDAGADLLIGHHPHVVQPYEQYENGWIFYSLGNFIFDQDFSTETSEGEIAKIIIKDKEIQEVSVVKTKINSSLQPEIID